MSSPIETRALIALYRNHPDTRPEERYHWRARLSAHEHRNRLLAWAATQSDSTLLSCRNLGVTTLAWIREATGTTTAAPTHDARCFEFAAHLLYCPRADAEERDAAHQWMADHYEHEAVAP